MTKEKGRIQKKVETVLVGLQKTIPDAHCALHHVNPFQLLVATVLSAQCTDERVNKVTSQLFKKYPTPQAFSQAEIGRIEEEIRSTGYFKAKARNIQNASRMIIEKFGGIVPDSMDELTQLPGVGRKTANVILSSAFGKSEGIVVDTHVSRVSQRLGLSKNQDPAKIEEDLMELFDRENWNFISHAMILHGRRVCNARKPDCEHCILWDPCDSRGKK